MPHRKHKASYFDWDFPTNVGSMSCNTQNNLSRAIRIKKKSRAPRTTSDFTGRGITPCGAAGTEADQWTNVTKGKNTLETRITDHEDDVYIISKRTSQKFLETCENRIKQQIEELFGVFIESIEAKSRF